MAGGGLDERHPELDDGRFEAPFRNGLFAEQRDHGGGRGCYSGGDFSALREIYRADPFPCAAASSNDGGTRAAWRAATGGAQASGTSTAHDRLPHPAN